jgi:trk system potassium uptake protein TrkH
MNVGLLLKLLSGLLVILSIVLSIPGIYALYNNEYTYLAFLGPAFIGATLGLCGYLSLRNNRAELNHRTGLAIVGATWITAGLLGSFPYYLSAVTPSFIDALFESVSGFTGTGATIMVDIESLPNSILLWRSITQWLAGMGIIVFFLAILPILGIGGVQLFKAEFTGPQKDKITPRIHETAKRLWGLYVGFTLVLMALLCAAGMSYFDAVNHAMTTVATGGFSTRNSGIAAFNSSTIEYIIICFMLMSSINYSLYFLFITSRGKALIQSTEAKWYLGILSIMTLIITLNIWGLSNGTLTLESAFRKALFSVVCTASSTGYTNVDYTAWPVGLQSLIILLMIMGGMSGSTSGGIKCVRIAATIKQLFKELKQVVHPRGVYTIKFNDHSVPPNVVSAIWGFIFLYYSIFTMMTLVFTFQGLDLVSAATASFSALSNIGPALGTLGPYDNFAALPDLSKVVFTCGMLLGRLEFYTLMVLFTSDYWRR